MEPGRGPGRHWRPADASLRCAALGLADARSMAPGRGPGRHWRPTDASLRCAALGLADARSIAPGRGPGRHWRPAGPISLRCPWAGAQRPAPGDGGTIDAVAVPGARPDR